MSEFKKTTKKAVIQTAKKNNAIQKKKVAFSKPANDISMLQKSVGNQTVQRLMKSGVIQVKNKYVENNLISNYDITSTQCNPAITTCVDTNGNEILKEEEINKDKIERTIDIQFKTSTKTNKVELKVQLSPYNSIKFDVNKTYINDRHTIEKKIIQEQIDGIYTEKEVEMIMKLMFPERYREQDIIQNNNNYHIHTNKNIIQWIKNREKFYSENGHYPIKQMTIKDGTNMRGIPTEYIKQKRKNIQKNLDALYSGGGAYASLLYLITQNENVIQPAAAFWNIVSSSVKFSKPNTKFKPTNIKKSQKTSLALVPKKSPIKKYKTIKEPIRDSSFPKFNKIKFNGHPFEKYFKEKTN